METVFNAQTGKTERVYKRDKPAPKRQSLDEQTEENLRQNQFQKKGTNFYAGGFGLVGEARERFLHLKQAVSIGLEKLQESEKASRIVQVELGSNAYQIQLLVQNFNAGKSKHKRIAHRTVFKKLFGQRANRIYEAIAIHRAVEAGAYEFAPTTSLIRIGEKLGNQDLAETFLGEVSEKFESLDSFSRQHRSEVVKFLKDVGNEAKPLTPLENLEAFYEEIEKAKVKIEAISKLDWKTIGDSRLAETHVSNIQGKLIEIENALKAILVSLQKKK